MDGPVDIIALRYRDRRQWTTITAEASVEVPPNDAWASRVLIDLIDNMRMPVF